MHRSLRLAVVVSLWSAVALVAGCPSEPSAPDAGFDAGASDGGVDAARACTDSAGCSDGLYCNGEETCGPAGVCVTGTAPSCDDGIACTVDRCVESRRACESAAPDRDGDGFGAASCRDAMGVALGTDCNDDDATSNPGATEICDPTHDEDCDPSTFGVVDVDGDGHPSAACCNAGGACGTDCNDADPNVSPSDAEVCNGVDDDCDAMLDEGLPIVAYRPDCDHDGYGDDTATPTMACTTPTTPTPCAGGAWVMIGGDCADGDPGRNTGNPEVCNGIDDDCNVLVDDIIHGHVVCAAGETQACHNAACGTDGLATCNGTCLGFDACRATEVCNGCDDDGNGAVDDGFECARGTSGSCTVAACGTAGTHVCSTTCGWGACTASESCNYCDDDGDGNFWDERPFATASASANLSDCTTGYTLNGPGTACDTVPVGAMGFDLYAQLLDGTSNDQAGAFWMDPTTWVQGWGSTEVTVELEATAVTAGGAAEIPLGGWAVVIGRAGTSGVGTPQNRGIPTTVQGIAASWFWSTYDSCSAPGNVPDRNDSVRFQRLSSGAIIPIRSNEGGPSSTCQSGDGIEGAATDFDGVASGVVRERIQFRYTPDDPTTTAVNEEAVRIIASTPGAGSAITYTYSAASDLPIGSGPLRIGVTAGTYTQSGFSGTPSGLVFGVPVRARVRLFNQTNHSLGPPTFTYYLPVTRSGLCP